jgi:tetratricopeptide (TPR) repeat protein
MVVGCGEKPERHLDLGLWYYQKGLVDDAILEFKEVVRLLPADPRRMSGRELDVVARAHYNLAIAYAKKNWYELALIEAGKTFELRPTPENYELQELIRKRKDMESLSPSAASRPE